MSLKRKLAGFKSAAAENIIYHYYRLLKRAEKLLVNELHCTLCGYELKKTQRFNLLLL